jgi:hypothetical protein
MNRIIIIIATKIKTQIYAFRDYKSKFITAYCLEENILYLMKL